ncbi:MAG: hypothetical protein BGP06_16405 [Rhizobiales bacterium 65-9]|nr:nuclear transport factor 2 family protein [Hyphomicrobiales bacterium]OJY38042.1 MAG: hypothetical protein BGP06_16405 [Rhizobiales bacterium 65-9]
MSASASVRALLEAKAAALVTKSADILEQMIDPNFLYVNSLGNKFGKEEFIAVFCRSGAITFLNQRLSNIEVIDYDAFAIASLTIEDHIIERGELSAGHYRSLCVFRNVNGRWRWAAGQTSSVL